MSPENTNQQSLLAVVAQSGLQPLALGSKAGVVLVTTHGARVLGIFLPRAGGNMLWTNPAALADSTTAEEFLAKGEWNLGGDRSWLSPENELCFLDAENPSHENHAVPAVMDPGKYTVTRQYPNGVVLGAEGTVRNMFSNGEFTFRLTRGISLCAPPVKAPDLDYIGYELSSDLVITTPDQSGAKYGLWQLMQLPAGGTLSIPLRSAPQPVDYFCTGAASHYRLTDRCLTFPITGDAKHKIGLTAREATGLMSYFRPVGSDHATLIVRQAAVFPGATYADYPAGQRNRRDIAIQAYNDAGGLGPFGEMEYHSPAACAENGFHVRDVSRTWCFAGPLARIGDIQRELLDIATD